MTEKRDAGKEQPLKRRGQLYLVMSQLRYNYSAMIGLGILAAFILAAVFAPYVTQYRYDEMTGVYLSPPVKGHPFGTDNLGYDLFSRVLYGTRYSMGLGIGATLIAAAGGITIGCAAGYYGGPVDEVFMRFSDILQSIPSVLLNMALAVAFGGGFVNTMLALGIANIAGVARMQRSTIINNRRMEYLDAASAITCSDFRIITRHLLPNSFAPVLVYSTMRVGSIIMSAAGLSFLGIGISPPTPEWGVLLSSGRDFIKNAPYLTLFPGIFLIIFVLSINLLGDGLRDALDPKLKK